MHALDYKLVPVRHTKSQNHQLSIWIIWISKHVTIILDFVLLGSTRVYLGVVQVFFFLEFPLMGVHTFLVWFICIYTHLCRIVSLVCSVRWYMVELFWYWSEYIMVVPLASQGNNFRYQIMYTWRLGWKLLSLYLFWTWLNPPSWLILFLYNQCDFHLQWGRL